MYAFHVMYVVLHYDGSNMNSCKQKKSNRESQNIFLNLPRIQKHQTSVMFMSETWNSFISINQQNLIF